MVSSSLLERKANESKLEYLLRLCKYKIEEKPNDLDWQDIVELTNLNVHRDSLRKAMNIQFGVSKHSISSNWCGTQG